MCTISTSTQGAADQSDIISKFASDNTLNSSKTEIVRFSEHPQTTDRNIELQGSTPPILSHAKCLGYNWSSTLFPVTAIEENIKKVCRQSFTLGLSGCFLGSANPLSSKAMFEICVLSTLLYGAENWIMTDASLALLDKFQAEVGRRILRLSKYHLCPSVLVALGWPSMKARVLNVKLAFFAACSLLCLLNCQ